MYRLSPAAQRDLSSIWDFTEERWSIHQAEVYVTEIRFAFERIAESPDRGRQCDEICEGYRRYAIGSHLIFYVENNGGVDVIRILHQWIDTARYL